MSKSHLQQGMYQGMTAGAGMQLGMRILQASQMELEQIVTQALQSNPTLEEQISSSPPAEQSAAPSNYNYIEQVGRSISLQEHLQEQILQDSHSPALTAAALDLVEQLDERGYFDEDNPPQDSEALRLIQSLDPAGVGARSLAECLLLQLSALGEGKGIAAELISQHWQQLIQHRYADAAKAMDLEEDAIRGAAHRIARLSPHPGSNFAPVEQDIIIPDVEVIEEDPEGRGEKQLLVTLTGAYIPQLALNADYRSMMAEQAENAQVRSYLSRCFREGRELIAAIEQRQHNLLLVARAIVTRQRQFFTDKQGTLQPLKMEQIAEDTQLHLSTVSRAVRGKYLHCKRGSFELRSFFAQELVGVEQRIKQLIAEESPQSVLSDADLVQLLREEGVEIARRTVSKYRERLGILPAALRKG